MHSRKKVPKDEEKEKARFEKAKKFNKALTKFLEMKKNGCKDRTLLKPIGDLLYASPDFYTLWNYRREIFIAFKEEIDNIVVVDDESKSNYEELGKELDKLCTSELGFIQQCLKINYKSYGTWHHRYWLIEFMKNPDLKHEIELCNKFLMLDERNFHCWNYRRFVIKLANVDIFEELDFSIEKIEQNFSNFSSWYYRSSLLTKLCDIGYDQGKLKTMIDDDYRRVEEAVFTDPSDQSVWFYLRWLCSLYSDNLKSLSSQSSEHSILKMNRFYWMSFSSESTYFVIEFNDFLVKVPQLTLKVNNKLVYLKQWRPLNNGSIWIAIADWCENNENNFTFELNFDSQLKISDLSSTFSFLKQNATSQTCFIYNHDQHSKKSLKIDQEKYDTLKQLFDLEPDNKWVNFTLASLESNEEVMNNSIDNLIQMDQLRVNYYNDLRSKNVLMKKLSDPNLYSSRFLSLANLNIYSLRDMSRLIHIQYLDLSDNRLIKLGTTFSPLISLQCLLLDNNHIHLFDKSLDLPNLKILSLKNNEMKKFETIKDIVSSFEKLEHLCLIGNPLRDNIQQTLQNKMMLVKVYFNNSDEMDMKIMIKNELSRIENCNPSVI